MIKYKKKIKEVEVIEYFNCDFCGKKIKQEDHFEWDEMHRIHFVGGYGSVFGDGCEVQCDICQNCVYQLIKNFAKMEYV